MLLIRLFLFITVMMTGVPAFGQDYETVAAHAGKCRQRLTEIGLLGKEWKLPPWYCQDPVARTFKGALAADQAFRAGYPSNDEFGRHNPACQPFVDLGWKCSYNIRAEFTEFLAVYGKVIFPTNQHFSEPAEEDEWPGNRYIGDGDQNELLIKVMKQNIDLLQDGDLTAEEVVNSWR